MSREQRRLFHPEEQEAEPGRYGCPMLARTRRYDATHPVNAGWRCSLGWAIHGEMDAACCMATESVTDCWKVHPERKPIVDFPVPPLSEQKASAD